jgi:hypothetical protein
MSVDRCLVGRDAERGYWVENGGDDVEPRHELDVATRWRDIFLTGTREVWDRGL